MLAAVEKRKWGIRLSSTNSTEFLATCLFFSGLTHVLFFLLTLVIQIMCCPPAHSSWNQPVSTWLSVSVNQSLEPLLTAQFRETEGPSVLTLHLEVIFCLIHRCIPLTNFSQKGTASPVLLKPSLTNAFIICRKCCKQKHWLNSPNGFQSYLSKGCDKGRGIISAENIEIRVNTCRRGIFFLLQVRGEHLYENGAMSTQADEKSTHRPSTAWVQSIWFMRSRATYATSQIFPHLLFH